MNSKLIEAYRNTTYTAATPRGELRLRIGDTHPELDALLREHDAETWSFITAWNPASEPLDAADNRARQARLEAELAGAGYVFFAGKGEPDESDWEAEESVLVVGIARHEAVGVGVRYGQNAIVCGHVGEPAALVWCVAENVNRRTSCP
ncbi:MAG: DUF3293 domain-containing protein [Persicimonas sp.]